jgi:hypothetical protein
MSQIDKLTPEQEALIPLYRQKWWAIALSTEPIDRQKAASAAKAAYALHGALHGDDEPEILFFDSLYAALKDINDYFPNWGENEGDLFYILEYTLKEQLSDSLHYELYNQLLDPLCELLHELWKPLLNQLYQQPEIPHEVADNFVHDLNPQYWFVQCSFIDFCVSVLNCSLDQSEQSQWEGLQSFAKNCGWMYYFFDEDTSLICVCDRPIKLSFDEDYRLHAEAEPALQFTEGYSLYSHHGVTLPEKYGTLHPHQWQAQWLLEEDNAELRRLLIQVIGYARVCQELQAQQLDFWQEYTLLKIDNDVDIEPIYLLKMTCPSTGFIHALRVPPDMKSAREAIRWVNWGIDPEQFGVQT